MSSDAAPAFIPLCVPELAGREWEYVKECLDTGWVSSVGGFVTRFEKEFAAWTESPHAVATVNGTSALHVALLCAGVQPDDEVLVSTLTFIAPANAVRYCNAWPVFVDCDEITAMMDVGRLRDFLEQDCTTRDGVLVNGRTGRRVGAILPVHILGHGVDMTPLMDLAARYTIPVIEDATEALGASYQGRPLGTLGDAGCFSFNGNKLITSGAGGMLVSPNAETAKLAAHLTTQAKDHPLEYRHDRVGYNYRLSNVQAAIGCAQLEMAAAKVDTKRAIAAHYRDAFAGNPALRLIEPGPGIDSCWWMPSVVLGRDLDRNAIGAALKAQGIETRPLWLPMHLNPAHDGAQVLGGAVAERLQQRTLSLPCSCGLTAGEQERVISTLLGLVSKGA